VADFETPIPLEEGPDEGAEAAPDDPMSALMALSREQQRRRDEALTRLRALSQQQGAQAQGLRSLALISSFGQNPLLQGLQREAGSQGAQLQGMASQAEGRADMLDRGGGLDPLGFARLQQMAEHQRKQNELAGQRLAQQAEAARLKAEAAKNKAAAGAAAAEKKRADKLANADKKSIDDLRKEFEGLKVVKDYRDASVAHDKVKAAFAAPSAANDMAGIYAVMKVYDPGSVVKETEFANAENAKGVPDWLRAKWNKVREGERLTDEQRADFARSAEGQFGAHRNAYEEQAIRYADLAPAGNAERVIGGPPPKRKQSPASPTGGRTPATQALPQGPGGSLLLESPPGASSETVRVKINGVERPTPVKRSQLEAMKKKAAERKDTLEVIDG
jgi:hypothetical protein